MFFVAFDFEHSYIKKWCYTQMVFINECKYCKISNQMFFNVMFLFSKTKGDLLMT